MNLRSDIIDTVRLGLCAAEARITDGQDIHVSEQIATKGRSTRWSITFYCASHHGKRRTNRSDGEMAASWTAYGYLIARLFLVDPAAIIGSYKGVADFVKQCEQCRAWKTKTDGPNALDFLKLLEDCTVIA